MPRPVPVELYRADMELGRFIRSEYREALRHGYPTMAAFAKEISRGTLALPPTPDDPVQDAVSRFYFRELTGKEQDALSQRYVPLTSVKKRHESFGLSRRGYDDMVMRLIRRCHDYLVKHT